MGKINPGLYSSEAQDWMTPPDLVDALLRFENRGTFDLDPCCSRTNIPALRHFLEQDVDGLGIPWGDGLVFMNPPYGNVLKHWMEKAWREYQKGAKVWVLIPARTETVYQHDFGLAQAGFAVFLKGRLRFVRNGDFVPHIQQFLDFGGLECQLEDEEEEILQSDGVAPFPTMLLYFGDDWAEKAQRWIANPPLRGTLMSCYRG
jgi:hypothetical protein